MSLFNLFNKDSNHVHSEQDVADFLDGFRQGYPLAGQPEYPSCDSEAYQRGLAIGRQKFSEHGQPSIPYEPEEMEG